MTINPNQLRKTHNLCDRDTVIIKKRPMDFGCDEYRVTGLISGGGPDNPEKHVTGYEIIHRIEWAESKIAELTRARDNMLNILNESNKSDWLDNPGYMPVAEGTLIDVEYRGGEFVTDEEAGNALTSDWNLRGSSSDIIRYRIKNSNDQWLDNPGYMPVSRETKVDVEHRNGNVFTGCRANIGRATNWTITGSDFDIIRYRVWPQ